MVGMIEQIHGSGLSGITGKATSHSKNSLFATLMGILEKHAQGSGKGLQADGQQHATLLGKGQTGKAKSLFAMVDKSAALITKKHAHLLTLATKDKHEKKKADDSVIPLIAANVIIAQTAQSKKVQKAAKTTLDALAGQTHSKDKPAITDGQIHKKSNQALLNQALPATTKAVAKEADSTLKDQSAIHGQALPAATKAMAKAADATLQTSGKLAVSTHKTARSTQQSQITDGNHSAASTQALASAGNTITGSIDQIMSNSNKQSKATDATVGASTKEELMSAQRLAQQSAQRPADALDTQNNATTGRPDALQTQQGKHAKTKQNSVSQNSMNLSAITNIAAGTSDTSLTDSGSHSSNSGNHQDGSHIQVIAGDAKSVATSLSAHTQFQHYMSDKTAPSMTLFDSMTHIAQSARKGKTQLDIQLEPANLGKIQISLQSDAAKQLHVHMIVDQSATRQLIDQQLPVLKQALAQQGFDLSGFSMGSQNQQPSSGGDQAHAHAPSHSAGSTLESSDITTTASPNRIVSDTGLSIRI